MRVIVTGRLKQRSFETKGEKRTVIEMDVDEVGPSLKYATAKVNNATRTGPDSNGSSTPVDDPWATAPTRTVADSFQDEIPF